MTGLIDAGKEVVVVMHSYGGVVGTEALHGLGLENRKTAGNAGGVKRMIFLTAFIPQLGQSLAGIFGGKLPPFIEVKVCTTMVSSSLDLLYTQNGTIIRTTRTSL